MRSRKCHSALSTVVWPLQRRTGPNAGQVWLDSDGRSSGERAPMQEKFDWILTAAPAENGPQCRKSLTGFWRTLQRRTGPNAGKVWLDSDGRSSIERAPMQEKFDWILTDAPAENGPQCRTGLTGFWRTLQQRTGPNAGKVWLDSDGRSSRERAPMQEKFDWILAAAPAENGPQCRKSLTGFWLCQSAFKTLEPGANVHYAERDYLQPSSQRTKRRTFCWILVIIYLLNNNNNNNNNYYYYIWGGGGATVVTM